MRVIDADALLEKIDRMDPGYSSDQKIQRYKWPYRNIYRNAVKAAPTVYPLAKRGYWMPKIMYADDQTYIKRFICSECGKDKISKLWIFCPYCGAWNAEVHS